MARAIKIYRVFSETVRREYGLRRAERKGALTPEVRKTAMVEWANDLLDIVGVNVSSNRPALERPSLFVGNHISYLDIPLLMSQLPVNFVAKKELASWPIFGTAMKAVGTVFVEREAKDSRKNIGATIAPYLLEQGRSVVIFPSGTTTMYEERPWRWGAFRLAKEYGIPIIPFRLKYEPLRKAAYLLEDSFPTHLWGLLGEKKIEARLEFHPPVEVTDPEKDAERWWNWTKTISWTSLPEQS